MYNSRILHFISIVIFLLSDLSLGMQDLDAFYQEDLKKSEDNTNQKQHESDSSVYFSVKISLLKSISIGRDNIMFSDVAECQGDRDLCEDISSIEIGKSPPPGGFSLLRKPQIKNILEIEFPRINFSLSGPEVVRISADFQVPEITHIEESFWNYLADLDINLNEIKIQLNKIYFPTPLRIRNGNYSADFVKDGRPKKVKELFKGGIGTFKIAFKNPDNDWDPVIGEIKIYAKISIKALLAVEDLTTGTIISDKNTSMQFWEINHGLDDVITTENSVYGMVVKNFIKEGRALRKWEIEKEKLVKKGEKIKVRFFSDGIESLSTATAASNGGGGDKISATLDKSRKKIIGKVVGKSLIEMVM